MDDLNLVSSIADKIGVIVLMVGFGVALYRKIIVFGWLYGDCDEERATLRLTANQRADKIEAELERLRAQREGRSP